MSRIFSVSVETGRRWANGELSDSGLLAREHPVGRVMYVGDIQDRDDLFDAFLRYAHHYAARCSIIIFRAHAIGIERLAINCGMCACVNDSGNLSDELERLTGKRFVGDKTALINIVAKFDALVKRKLKQRQKK